MTTFTSASGCSCLGHLDADAGDDPVQRVPHDLGVRVPHDHVPLAEVVGAGGLARLRHPRLYDEVPARLLDLVDPGPRPHPTAAHPAQVGRAGRVPALRDVEAAEDD